MPTYHRQTRVRAPFEEVWDFHSRVEGLVTLTPPFMNLRIDATLGPDGDRDPEVLEAGSKVYASVRPFGLGPRQRWLSTIVEREEWDGAAYFADEMEEGPFPYWRHTHSFEEDGDGTIVGDHVEYQLPLGPVGSVAGVFGDVGFEPMFRYRHRKTRERFE